MGAKSKGEKMKSEEMIGSRGQKKGMMGRNDGRQGSKIIGRQSSAVPSVG